MNRQYWFKRVVGSRHDIALRPGASELIGEVIGDKGTGCRVINGAERRPGRVAPLMVLKRPISSQRSLSLLRGNGSVATKSERRRTCRLL